MSLPIFLQIGLFKLGRVALCWLFKPITDRLRDFATPAETDPEISLSVVKSHESAAEPDLFHGGGGQPSFCRQDGGRTRGSLFDELVQIPAGIADAPLS